MKNSCGSSLPLNDQLYIDYLHRKHQPHIHGKIFFGDLTKRSWSYTMLLVYEVRDIRGPHEVKKKYSSTYFNQPLSKYPGNGMSCCVMPSFQIRKIRMLVPRTQYFLVISSSIHQPICMSITAMGDLKRSYQQEIQTLDFILSMSRDFREW